MNSQDNQAPIPVRSPIIMVPTVGRVMWYRPSKWDLESGMRQNTPSQPGEPQQPFRAMVDYVWGARGINATVTDHAGQSHFRSSCIVRQDGDPIPMSGDTPIGHCEWMPYQTGQARRELAELPVRTTNYSDGTAATGAGLLPESSPAQQDAQTTQDQVAESQPGGAAHWHAASEGDTTGQA